MATRAEVRMAIKAERDQAKAERDQVTSERREAELLMAEFAEAYPDLMIDPESGEIRPKAARAPKVSRAAKAKIASATADATANKVATAEKDASAAPAAL